MTTTPPLPVVPDASPPPIVVVATGVVSTLPSVPVTVLKMVETLA